MPTFYLAAILLFFTLAYMYKKNMALRECFCLAVEDDSDMKIARPGAIAADKNSAYESETLLFQTHKSNGNMEKAHNLGRSLADVFSSGEFDRHCNTENADIKKNLTLLFGFAAVKAMNSVLDGILSDTAQNTFFDCIKDSSAEIYEILNDHTGISFYFLEERTSKEKAEFGVVFASLCKEPTPETAKFGEDMFNLFYDICYKKILDEEFVEFELKII